MTQQYSNYVSTTLNGSITAGATSMVVNSSVGFPGSPTFQCVIDNNEIVQVTALAGNTWTITRAYEAINGTQVAASHANGAPVVIVLTAQSLALGFARIDQANISEITVPDLKLNGLTGATSPTRYVGATTFGAPTTGTFAVGDFVVTAVGGIYVCTTAGTPGTWTYLTQGLFNIKEYGAKIDGVTDDATAWTNTIAAAGASGYIWHPGGTSVIASGLILANAGNVILGAGWDSILSYSGAATALTMSNSRVGLENIRVLTTGNGASVTGVKINAAGSLSLQYPRLRNVNIAATTKTVGQIGLQCANISTSNIYWGDFSELSIENWDIGIQLAADPTLGINANRFIAPSIRNCNTSLDFGAGYGNVFKGIEFDLFTIGIKGTGTQNHIDGRLEGGVSAQSYTLQAGSKENLLIIDDNSPVTSTDVGTDNQVITLRLGQPKAWEFPTPYIAPFYPPLATGSGTVPNASNNAQFVKLSGITKAMSLSKVRLEVVIQSGNYCVGLYELVNTTLTQRATTGNIAVPVSGATEPAFSLAYTVRPGKVYYLALACDNITATFRALTGVLSTLIDVTSANVSGALIYATSTNNMMPLPATVAIGGLGIDSKIFALIGK